MYTPDSSCTTHSPFSVGGLVPLGKIRLVELPFDSASEVVPFAVRLSLESWFRMLEVFPAMEPALYLVICPSGSLSAISFNCWTIKSFKTSDY